MRGGGGCRGGWCAFSLVAVFGLTDVHGRRIVCYNVSGAASTWCQGGREGGGGNGGMGGMI